MIYHAPTIIHMCITTVNTAVQLTRRILMLLLVTNVMEALSRLTAPAAKTMILLNVQVVHVRMQVDNSLGNHS